VSFLDNLENNLKSLESRDEADGTVHRRRESDQNWARAIAPWAEKLKNSEFTKRLMQQATRAGFQLRTKVHITWIGPTLRLDGRQQRLELQPTPSGVVAVMFRGNEEVERKPVNLDDDPETLVREWTPMVEERKRIEEEQARASAALLEEADETS
jgi:hypothetical protein